MYGVRGGDDLGGSLDGSSNNVPAGVWFEAAIRVDDAALSTAAASFGVAMLCGDDPCDVYIDELSLFKIDDPSQAGSYIGQPNIVGQNSSLPGQDIQFAKPLTYKGMTPRYAELVESNCVSVTGTQSIGCGTGVAVSGSWSVSIWHYGDAADAAGGIIGRYYGGTGFLLYKVNTTGLRVYSGSGNLTVDDCIVTESWNHIVASWDGVELRIFVNGLEQPDGTVSLTPSDPTMPVTGHFYIGAFDIGPGTPGDFIAGDACDARVYDSALSAADVLAVYRGETITPQPVGHWPLSEGSGNTFYDVSGNGHHGVGANTPGFATQDVYHHNIRHGFYIEGSETDGRRFDGATQFLSGSSTTDLEIGSANAWVMVQGKVDDAETFGYVFSKFNSIISGREWAFLYNTPLLQFLVSADGATAPGSSHSIGTGAEFFAVGYFDNDASEGSLSVDGGEFNTPFSLAGPLATASADTVIAGKHGGGGTVLDGVIEKCAIGKPGASPDWNALRDLLYNSGNPKTYSELTDAEKTTLGVTAWYEPGGAYAGIDLHGSNNLDTVTGYSRIPARNDGRTIHRSSKGAYFATDRGDQEFVGESPIGSDSDIGDSNAWFLLRCNTQQTTGHPCGVWEIDNKLCWCFYHTSGVMRYYVTNNGYTSVYASVANDLGNNDFFIGYHDAENDEISISFNGGAFVTPTAHTGGIYSADTVLSIGRCNDISHNGHVHTVAYGKPGASPDWDAIKALLWNSGTPKIYADLSASDLTTLGVSGWYDLSNETDVDAVDQHAGNNLTQYGFGSLTNPAGNHHNGAETKINFAPEVEAPYTENLLLPADYELGDALPATMQKRRVTKPSGVILEDNFYVLKQ